MSKSLIKLVDEAILPAFVLVGVKVIAIALVNNLLSLSFYYENFGKIFYKTQVDAMLVNTWSDFSVFGVFLIVCLFLVIKLLFFSDGKTKPSLLLKLAKANRIGFIQTSIELYHIIFVWMVFLTGIGVYIFVRVLSFVDYPVVLIPLVICYLVIVLVVIKELEKDIIKKLDMGKKVFV